MPGPIKVITSSGSEVDRLSEDTLRELVASIEDATEDYAILERTEDPTGQTYAQVTRDPDGVWIVERRDGGSDRHYRAEVPNLESVQQALLEWAFEGGTGSSIVPWTKLE